MRDVAYIAVVIEVEGGGRSRPAALADALARAQRRAHAFGEALGDAEQVMAAVGASPEAATAKVVDEWKAAVG